MSVEQKEYERISDKHRKRVERINRDEEKHSEDNLKAKDAMRLMRENLSDEYIPRGRQNIKEEDEWKNFFDTNQESKELLKELKPEIVEEILAKQIKVKMEQIKKIEKKKDKEPQSCVCTHEFDNCIFCQNSRSDCSENDDDVYELPKLTEGEIKEYNRQDFENWKKMRQQERRDKTREKRRLLRNKLLEPIIMPDMKKCEYEKIRDNIIAQRKIEWSELERKMGHGK